MTIYALLMSSFLYLSILHFVEVYAILAVNGSTVQLLCPIKHTCSGTLDWLFRSTTASVFSFYASGKNVAYYLPDELKERLTVTSDHTKGEYHLNISNIRESDQGTYKCQTGVKIYEEALTIIVGPTNIIIQNVTSDNKIPGTEGKDMTIKCTAVGGQPAPDIKLDIFRTTYTGKQSAHHTFKPLSSDDGSTVICQAGYTEINFYPLTTSAYIHLMLRPLLTPFSPDIFSTEEAKSFDVSCQSTGSRPAASIYWLLGKEWTNITPNCTSKSIHHSSTDTYTVISTLRYGVGRRYNEQKLVCKAINNAGYIKTSLTLNVKYAPVVTVENKTFSQTQSPRQIYSNLDSNPLVNNCIWHHISKYGEPIREFNENNQILTLPTVSEDKRYQDTGEYVCTAENGIQGINGQVNQTGSGYVISNAPPVITADNKDNTTQYGMLGKSAELKVNTYSIPKYSSIRWYRGNTYPLSNKYATTEETAIVTDVFYGVKVQLNGYRVILTISALQEADFTNYTLRLYYGSQYVQHKVTLESASTPDTPSNFSITSSGATSITVQWIPGYDGGHTQIFFIEYRISGTDTWKSQKVRTISQLNTHNDYTLSGLQDKTTYELRMYAENRFNQSQRTYIESATTIKTNGPASSDAIIGAVPGVIVVLLILCVVIVCLVILKRRKGKKPTEKNVPYYENSGVKKEQTGDEYEEVANTRGMQQEQCSKTYESLGAKDAVGAVSVYDDLHNSNGMTSSEFPGDNYEALSAQDKPILYEELNKQKGNTEEVYVNEVL